MHIIIRNKRPKKREKKTGNRKRRRPNVQVLGIARQTRGQWSVLRGQSRAISESSYCFIQRKVYYYVYIQAYRYGVNCFSTFLFANSRLRFLCKCFCLMFFKIIMINWKADIYYFSFVLLARKRRKSRERRRRKSKGYDKDVKTGSSRAAKLV